MWRCATFSYLSLASRLPERSTVLLWTIYSGPLLKDRALAILSHPQAFMYLARWAQTDRMTLTCLILHIYWYMDSIMGSKEKHLLNMQKQPSYFFSVGPEKLIWTWQMQREGGLGKMQGSDPFFVDAAAAALREHSAARKPSSFHVREYNERATCFYPNIGF